MPTIAYLGPEHTNTHVAALKKFGRAGRYLHAPTVDDVFHMVERRTANYGVVPVENSIEGAVTHTLDRFVSFIDTPVQILGEIEQPIKHYLILAPTVTPARAEYVFSHPQALAQCHRWLMGHMPLAQRREMDSTAEAVRFMVECYKENKLHAAAIGRLDLAKKYHLKAVPIPEDRENKTRFLILGLGESPRGKHSKTSMLFSLKDRPGALYDALVPFKHEKINLTKIESRPSKKKAWEYYFFIDLEGHESEPRVKRALKALSRSTLLLRVLGSYPVAK